MSPTQHLGAAPEAAGPHHAAAILIDHRHARVIYLEDQPVDGGDIETEWTSRQFRVNDRHAKGGSGRVHPDSHDLFEAVAHAASRAGRVVLAGPGSAKHELLRWADRHMPGMRARVHAVQTVDRVTDGELVALARRSLGAEPARMVWPRNETL